MARLGIFLLILGIGSFLLPLIGLEFRLISLFGEYATIAAIVFIVLGAVLVFLDRRRTAR